MHECDVKPTDTHALQAVLDRTPHAVCRVVEYDVVGRRGDTKTEFQLPYRSGMSRHGAPVRRTQRMPLTVRRLFSIAGPPNESSNLPRPASAIPICYARGQSRNYASICTGTDTGIIQAPRPAVAATGRDLPRRTGLGRVVTD